MAVGRFPKLKTMMPNLPNSPMPSSGMGQRLASMPKSPIIPQTTGMAVFPMPSPKAAPASLPSIQSTANTATPIEIGDPKRLAKIGTILRLGRK